MPWTWMGWNFTQCLTQKVTTWCLPSGVGWPSLCLWTFQTWYNRMLGVKIAQSLATWRVGDSMMKMTQCVAGQPLAPVEQSNQMKLMKTIDWASRYPFPIAWHTFSVLTSSLDIIWVCSTRSTSSISRPWGVLMCTCWICSSYFSPTLVEIVVLSAL